MASKKKSNTICTISSGMEAMTKREKPVATNVAKLTSPRTMPYSVLKATFVSRNSSKSTAQSMSSRQVYPAVVAATVRAAVDSKGSQ